MPSATRRRLLATLGVVGTVGVAGCSGQFSGISPRTVDAVETGGERQLVWQYPAAVAEDHDDGIGYASVTFEGERSTDRDPPPVEFELNTTVGGIAATDTYADYEADRARFRLGPPSDYDATHQYRMWVQPPPWPELRSRYENRSGRREFAVELPEIDSGGTITFPLVLDPVEAVPDRVHCSVTVEASEPGTFGETVRTTARGTIDVAAVRSP